MTFSALRGSVIPAQTPVILGAKSSVTSASLNFWADDDNPIPSASSSSSSSSTVELVGSYDAMTVPYSDDNYQYYVLNIVKYQGTDNMLGFWSPVSTGATIGRNSCYLRAPKSAGAKTFVFTFHQ
ncbi:MAG: hypothetical protein PUF37_08810 [Prevotellaceae bacterium]|nr:hypothetical protein [Prevotellaceae bacterium]